MTNEHLSALLELGGAQLEADWSALPAGRTLTLHAAFQGVPLNVSKIVKLRKVGELLHLETAHGEFAIVSLSDVFAGTVDGQARSGRAAGFR
jgi:hypothetical protein